MDDLIHMGDWDYITKKAFVEALHKFKEQNEKEYYNLTLGGESPVLTGFFGKDE